MTGYPGKTRSLSWSHDGRWLATSGADACVVWPFKDKDGPMGKAPRECGVRSARVTQVAFHPARAGRRDRLCRRPWRCCAAWPTAAEILVRAPDDGAVSALELGRRPARGC